MRVLLAMCLLMVSSVATADEGCAIEDLRLYEKAVGGGDRDHVQVSTVYCADFLIRNKDSGSRFDARIAVTFTDGSSGAEKVKTKRLDPGETYPVDLCFGGQRVRKLSCSW